MKSITKKWAEAMVEVAQTYGGDDPQGPTSTSVEVATLSLPATALFLKNNIYSLVKFNELGFSETVASTTSMEAMQAVMKLFEIQQYENWTTFALR